MIHPSPNIRYTHIGSPETLKGLNKLYAIDPIESKNLWGFNRSGLVLPDRLPITLGPSGRGSATLPVGEDIVVNAPKDKTTRALLRLRFAGLVDGDHVVVRINGQPPLIAIPTTPLTAGSTSSWFEIPLIPTLIKAGNNRITVELATKRAVDASVVLDRLELLVTYQ